MFYCFIHQKLSKSVNVYHSYHRFKKWCVFSWDTTKCNKYDNFSFSRSATTYFRFGG